MQKQDKVKVCGNCSKFWVIKIAQTKEKTKETKLGHCLARTVYASNKAGNPVYPPGAKVMELPYAQHKIHAVRKDQAADNCVHYTETK